MQWLAGLHLLCAVFSFHLTLCCFLLSLPVDLLNIVLHSEPQVYLDWFHNLCMLLRADLSLIQRLVAKQYLKSD